jgi:hypothetical protein
MQCRCESYPHHLSGTEGDLSPVLAVSSRASGAGLAADFTYPVTALSLTTPTVSRDFIFYFFCHEHTLPTTRESRLSGCVLPLVCVTPTSSGRFRFIDPVLPTKHLFGHQRP